LTDPVGTFRPSDVEPTWDDPAYTRTATIPAGYMVPGRAGWYVGHLPNLEDIECTNLTTRNL
jgi:hypothetical protein